MGILLKSIASSQSFPHNSDFGLFGENHSKISQKHEEENPKLDSKKAHILNKKHLIRVY